jgi:hypothetical protein
VKKGEEPAKASADPAKVAMDLFKEIPNSKIKELYEHYKMDFQIFGYTADQYYSSDKQ